MLSTTSKVWLITGASKTNGLGQALASTAIARGDKVIITARSTKDLQVLRDLHPESSNILQLDVTDSFDKLVRKAKEAISMWGRIDVLVNNAATSLLGNVEELGEDGFRQVYKVNVMGVLNVTNAFLPYMRERRSGVVVFIGSRSAWRADIAATSVYSSSKAAAHAIADTFASELRPFNIRVLNVAPGGLRTDIFKELGFTQHVSLARPNATDAEVPEYAEVREKVKRWIDSSHGVQPGDARKVASIVTDVVRGEGVAEGREWPGTLFLGTDVEEDVRARCASVLKSLDEWRDISRSISYE